MKVLSGQAFLCRNPHVLYTCPYIRYNKRRKEFPNIKGGEQDGGNENVKSIYGMLPVKLPVQGKQAKALPSLPTKYKILRIKVLYPHRILLS